MISDKDIKSLNQQVTGGGVCLSLVRTEPCSQAATDGGGNSLCNLCWCLHTSNKAEDVISDENTELASYITQMSDLLG